MLSCLFAFDILNSATNTTFSFNHMGIHRSQASREDRRRIEAASVVLFLITYVMHDGSWLSNHQTPFSHQTQFATLIFFGFNLKLSTSANLIFYIYVENFTSSLFLKLDNVVQTFSVIWVNKCSSSSARTNLIFHLQFNNRKCRNTLSEEMFCMYELEKMWNKQQRVKRQ